MWITVGPALSILNIENSLPKRGRSMKKQILIVTAVALTAAVIILNGTSAAQQTPQTPQYQVGGFPYQPAPDVGVAALRQNQRAAAP